MKRLAVLGRVFRDGWMVVGVALALYLALEALYRVQGGLRNAFRGDGLVAEHPYQDSLWFPRYQRELEASFGLRWAPYVYFRRLPFQGEFINVDSAGRRATVQPHAHAAANVSTIFFFGGSTMWGDFQRDGMTLPSVVATRLNGGGWPVHAVNFGESGRVFTQSVLELILLLRGGARPDAVVFYDGINDVAAAVQAGIGGIPQNEFNRTNEFELGRMLRATEASLVGDVRAAANLARWGAERSQLYRRLLSATRRPVVAAGIDPDSLARAVVDAYLGMVDVGEALAAHYGFKAFYFWQPNLHATTKDVTAFEAELLETQKSSALGRQLTALHERVPVLLSAGMADRAPGRFADLSGLFADTDRPVFVDAIGHITEEAAHRIAQEIAQVLVREGFRVVAH